jgi:hypothetical protein
VRNSVSHIEGRTKDEILQNKGQRKVCRLKRKEQDGEDAQCGGSRLAFHAKYNIISVIK